MSITPFRFVQRRTTITGRIPQLSSLLTGEVYLQIADGTIYFKNANGDGLHTVITDASGFGLNKIKFSGATSGQIPLWDGGKFIPYGTGDFGSNVDQSQFVSTGQTGNFVSNSHTGAFITSGQTGNFVTNAQTGVFVTTGQTGAFGSNVTNNYYSNSTSYLNSGHGLNSLQQSGSNNNASGIHSVAIGSGNLAEKDFSFAFGKEAKASQYGEFVFSNGSFSEQGDSQYSLLMARATTNNASPTFLKINNSDKIFEVDFGSTVFFTINLVGVSENEYFSAEYRGVVNRLNSIGSNIYFLNDPSSSVFVKTSNNLEASVKASTSDNSIKIECIGDVEESMNWFAKIDIIKIKKASTNIQFQNLYFKATPTNNWYSLDNWFLTNSFEANSLNLPDENTNVYSYGLTGAYVDIDNALWKTPNFINTQNTIDESGICIASSTGKLFTGIIIGNSTFIGANPS